MPGNSLPQVSGKPEGPQFPARIRAGRGAVRVPLLTPGHRLCHRLSMTPEEHRAFWRNVQFTVDKDVVRTDRSNQFFRGEGNPNVETMR